MSDKKSRSNKKNRKKKLACTKFCLQAGILQKRNYTKQDLNYYLPIRLKLTDFDKNEYEITADLTMFMTFVSTTIKNDRS